LEKFKHAKKPRKSQTCNKATFSVSFRLFVGTHAL
jgi:hypothetical protein